MNTFQILVAVSLLTNPDPLPEKIEPAHDHWIIAPCSQPCPLFFFYQTDPRPIVSPVVQQLAVKLELMDKRETSYVLNDPNNFLCDMKVIRKRFCELRDAPLLAESQRFPERDLINDLLSYNRNYREELCSRLRLDHIHSQQIRQAIDETDHLYRVWNTLRDARCGYYYISVRRQALKDLRELVGDAAFYRGELPPHLPLWRIPRER